MGQYLLEEANKATAALNEASDRLASCAVPSPEERTITATVLRKLAIADESMSAQQLCDLIDRPFRPTATSVRAFLHSHKPSVFCEVRRGSFILGSRYTVVGATSR